MKNFFKKLSFVLASAMVITSLYAPANTSAAAKDGIILKGKAVTKKGIFVGGDKLNFDYKIGKHNNKGANGKWSVSDTSVITVDKHGKVTAVGTGSATLYLKVKKNAKKGIKKNLTFKVKINAMARASELTIPASDKAITLKVGEVKDIMPVLTDKVEGVKNTYTLFAKSSDDSVATAKAENGKVVVEAKMATSSAVTVTVFAAQKNSAEEAMNNKYKVEDSFTVTVKGALEAKQVKANKVLVAGSDFSKVTTSGAFEVRDSKGNKLTFKEAVALNEDKTEATLEFTTNQVPADKYTVKFGESTAEFTAEKARVAKIEIVPEDEAFAVNTDPGNGVKYGKAVAFYKVYNQFEEDVTNSAVASDVMVTGGKAVSPKGKIEFENATGFIPGMSTVAVSVVDRKTSLQATKVLKVINEARAQDVDFKGIWDVSKGDFVKSIPEDGNLNVYRLLFKATSLHGVDIDYKKTSDNLSVMLLTTTGLTLKDKGTEYEVKGEKYAAYTIGYPGTNNKLDRSGKVEVRAIALYGGKTDTDEFEVVPMSKVAKLEVSDDYGIYAGDTAVLGYKAYDTNGNLITDWKTLSKMNKDARLKASDNGLVRFEKTRDKKVILTYTTNTKPAEKTVGYVTISWQTLTDSFDNKIMTVNPAKKPVGIIGLESHVATAVTRFDGKKLTFKVKDFIYEDQYGNPMPAWKFIQFKAGFKIKPDLKYDYFLNGDGTSAATGLDTINNLDDVVLELNVGKNQAAGADPASKKGGAFAIISDKSSYTERVKVTLLDKNDSDKELGYHSFDISNVRLEDVTGIAVNDIPLLPATTNGATNQVLGTDGNNLGADDNDYTPRVYGYYGAKKVWLTAGLDKDFFVRNGKDNDTKMTIPNADTLTDKEKTKEAKVYVVINNSAATTLEKTYKYSMEKAVPTKVILLPEGTPHLVINTGDANQKYWKDIKANFKLVSQYYNDQLKDDNKFAYVNMSNHVPYITMNDYNDDLVVVDKNGQKGHDSNAEGFNFKYVGGEFMNDKVTLTLKVPGTAAGFEDIVTVAK